MEEKEELNIYGNIDSVYWVKTYCIGTVMELYCNTGALVLYWYCIALKKLVLFILDALISQPGQMRNMNKPLKEQKSQTNH